MDKNFEEVTETADDPFSEQRQQLYRVMIEKLKDLDFGKTIAIQADSFEEALVIRNLLHPVSKALKWKEVYRNGSWGSYLSTIKNDNRVFIRRIQ